MNEEDKSFDQIKNILDSIIDNIIKTPDDEILKEVKEDYGDPEYEANIMRKIVKDATIQVNKDKLIKAKQNLETFKARQRIDSSDITISKEFDETNFNELTIAARDGKDISENDMNGIREDLEDLKKMASWKDSDSNDKT